MNVTLRPAGTSPSATGHQSAYLSGFGNGFETEALA